MAVPSRCGTQAYNTAHTLKAEQFPIRISRLELLNFRNYRELELELEPGMTLVHGRNGQGKSNLLEAVYMVVIGKSARTATERDLVLREPIAHEVHTQVIADAKQDGETVRIMVGYRVSPCAAGDQDPAAAQAVPVEEAAIQKYVRINGLPRRVAHLVGRVTGVMFAAQDLELIFGSPASRRRYLDIINSQLDPAYLRSLQRYQRVLRQRNHLLKSIRSGRAPADELPLWDSQLADEGAYVTICRRDTVMRLAELAGPIHEELSGGSEPVDVEYLPSVRTEESGVEGIGEGLAEALAANRDRDIAAGATTSGPHRDDARIVIDRRDAAAFASRGQARTATLALKLAEARYISGRSERQPLLLLDDVLSELDPARRSLVLEHVSKYEQCLITTADPESIKSPLLDGAARYEVDQGTVTGNAG